jgi:hypothetical protein
MRRRGISGSQSADEYVQLCTLSQNKLWRSKSIFNLWQWCKSPFCRRESRDGFKSCPRALNMISFIVCLAFSFGCAIRYNFTNFSLTWRSVLRIRTSGSGSGSFYLPDGKKFFFFSKQFPGSMAFWCGSWSGDPCLWLIDSDANPDPAIFVIDLQDANKKLILKKVVKIVIKKFFCLLLFAGTFTSFFKDKKSKRNHKTVGIKVFLSIFAW